MTSLDEEQPTLPLDEETIANELGSRVVTSLGPPPECTYNARSLRVSVQGKRLSEAASAATSLAKRLCLRDAPSHPPRVSALTAQMPEQAALQEQGGTGGRLARDAAQRAWHAFFGPGGPAERFHDSEAMRIAAGWTPELELNPVQQRLPRVRRIHDVDEHIATDALVNKQVFKGMLEEIDRPALPSEMAQADIDHAMVTVPGVPFPVPRTVYTWVHDFFIVPKSEQGEWRGITNAKEYNEYCHKHRFKLEGLNQLRAIIRPLSYMTGFDIKDFFPHVSITPRFRDHFVFRHVFKDRPNVVRWFRSVGLIMGITDAPRATMRLLRPILAYLRSYNVRLAMFCDDGLIEDWSAERLVEATQLTIDTLHRLHFLLHPEKCKLRPALQRQYLGCVVDTTRPEYVTLRLPTKRLKGIARASAQAMSKLKAGKPLPLRSLASLLGKQRAARDCVTVTYLMTRELLRWQNATIFLLLSRMGINVERLPFFDEEMCFVLPDEPLLGYQGEGQAWLALVNWDTDVFTVLPSTWVQARTPLLLREQSFWRDELRNWNGKWLHGSPPPETMKLMAFESDASKLGGGLCMDDPAAEARWHWLPEEIPNSINWKELVSPELGLRAVEMEERSKLFPHLKSSKVNMPTITGLSDSAPPDHRGVMHQVLVDGQLDNTTAVSYLNKQGGANPKLSFYAERLWKWLLQRGAWFQCRHLAGVLNVRADTASRWRDDRSEWRLSQEAWRKVEQLHGPHTVDLFASRRNTQLPRFFSRWLDPDSSKTDALQQRWELEENAYAHPPIAIVSKVLAKVRECRCTITLIAPVWASQAWLAGLMELSVALPHLLLCETLVEPVLPTKFAIKQPGWTTAVWRLSGDTSVPRVSVTALRAVLWPSTRPQDTRGTA